MKKIVGKYTVTAGGGQVRIEGGDEPDRHVVFTPGNGGLVEMTTYVPGYSTTKIVSKEALQAAIEMLTK